MITAAQAIVDCLRREGIDHVFGIPGTMNLPILDVLRATPEIRFVLTRHEQGAAFMAYGFARALNRPGDRDGDRRPGRDKSRHRHRRRLQGPRSGHQHQRRAGAVDPGEGREPGHRSGHDAPADHQVGVLDPVAEEGAGGGAARVPGGARRAARAGPSRCVPRHPRRAGRSRAHLAGSLPSQLAAGLRRKRARPRGGGDRESQAADFPRRRRRSPRGRAPGAAAAGREHRDSRRDAAIPPGRVSDDRTRLRSGRSDATAIRAPTARMPQADVVVALGAHIDTFSTTFKYGIISRDAKLIHHSMVGTDIGVVFPVAQAIVGSTLSFIEGSRNAWANRRRDGSMSPSSRRTGRPSERPWSTATPVPSCLRWWPTRCARRCRPTGS